MPEQLICPRCGAANPVGSPFCARCGWSPAPVRQPPGQQPPGQQPPPQGPGYQPAPGPESYGSSPQPYGYGQPAYGYGGAQQRPRHNRRLLFILIPSVLGLVLVVVLGVIFVPRLLHRDSASPVAPPATSGQPTDVAPRGPSQQPSAPASGPPSADPSGTPPAKTSSPPPDYKKLGPMVSSGIFKIIATGCSDGGSRIGSAFLINKDTAVSALSSLAGAKVISISDGSSTIPATVSAADPDHGVVVLKLAHPSSGHVFSLDSSTYATGDPVGAYGVAVKGSHPSLIQSKISDASADAIIAGTKVSGVADTGSNADDGMSGAPTLAADGHANGMVLLDSSGAMLIIPGKTIAAAVKKGGGSLPGTGCSKPVGPDSTVITGTASKRIASTLEGYFNGINSGDYSAAFARLSRRLQAGGYKGYADGWQTSYDFNIVVHQATGSSAHVTFDSIFEKGKGPKGADTCARWDIDYRFVTEDGKPVIDKAEPHSGAIWRRC